ncbi:hypothetical protein RFI_24228 [Reticulomyxa filosa]|uniref:Uncharacterized protein n=1 Tax=Reticulomyxa filosa TaxID=46433 RepID=X6MI85_RETFI|nr:hypothetical protein RFI_24228 [Reticulomyxa filosa]|eukprot:ETO13147.1 hypothetical protein RFI_24228 [Reticulomyxa filosa]
MIIGDKRKFLTALVTLKVKQNLDTMEFTNELTGVALDVSSNSKTVEDARKDPKWTKYIDDAFKKYNNDKEACVSNAQKIQYWRILDGDFSVPKDEMTSTLKLKRSVIHKNHEKAIDSMYEAAEINPIKKNIKKCLGCTCNFSFGGGSLVLNADMLIQKKKPDTFFLEQKPNY